MVTSINRVREPLNKEEKQLLRQAANTIEMDTFNWASTTQGNAYWCTVVNNLRTIANEKTNCETCGQEIKN